MNKDNILNFPTPEELNINDEEFWETCSEIYHVFANLSVSMLRLQVADADEMAAALCVVSLALLKAKNTSDSDIEDFADMIFKRHN